MQKEMLAPEIIRYQFDPEPGKYFGNSILAVIDGAKAMLIDTGFEDQAKAVSEDLFEQNVVVEAVLLSHFHGDHMYGLKALPDVPKYGSAGYKVTLDLWYADEDCTPYIPTTLIDQKVSIGFGSHRLTVIPSPGHSECTVIAVIDNQFVHCGDELMYSNDGQPILPSVDGLSTVKRHLDSLQRLRDYTQYAIIPGHGSIMRDEQFLREDVDNRYRYLSAVYHGGEKLTYEQATRDCSCTFLHAEWHDHLYAE